MVDDLIKRVFNQLRRFLGGIIAHAFRSSPARLASRTLTSGTLEMRSISVTSASADLSAAWLRLRMAVSGCVSSCAMPDATSPIALTREASANNVSRSCSTARASVWSITRRDGRVVDRWRSANIAANKANPVIALLHHQEQQQCQQDHVRALRAFCKAE